MLLLICGIKKIKQINKHNKIETYLERTNRWLPEWERGK